MFSYKVVCHWLSRNMIAQAPFSVNYEHILDKSIFLVFFGMDADHWAIVTFYH